MTDEQIDFDALGRRVKKLLDEHDECPFCFYSRQMAEEGGYPPHSPRCPAYSGKK